MHSDLKPANIMLVSGGSTRDGEPESKLLDFGLARFQTIPRIAESGMSAADHAGSTGRGVIAGTPQYMAPEQVRGEEADPRSDIFSFGCVLYEMVSGRAAFAAAPRRMSCPPFSTRIQRPCRSVDLDRRRTPRNASRRLGKLIERCLEKVPDRRFDRMLDVKIELQADRARRWWQPTSAARDDGLPSSVRRWW